MTESGAVLDASAVLAVLNAEPGCDQVLPFLGKASMSAVNYAEVATKLMDRGAMREDAREVILGLGVAVIDFDLALAERAAELRASTRHRGLSLGDRACLALAARTGAPAVTADRSWQDVLPDIDVRVVR